MNIKEIDKSINEKYDFIETSQATELDIERMKELHGVWKEGTNLERTYFSQGIFFSTTKQRSKFSIQVKNGFVHYDKSYRQDEAKEVIEKFAVKKEPIQDLTSKETVVNQKLKLSTIKSLIDRPGVYSFCGKLIISVNVSVGGTTYDTSYTTPKTRKQKTRQYKSVGALFSLAYRQEVVKKTKKTKNTKSIELAETKKNQKQKINKRRFFDSPGSVKAHLLRMKSLSNRFLTDSFNTKFRIQKLSQNDYRVKVGEKEATGMYRSLNQVITFIWSNREDFIKAKKMEESERIGARRKFEAAVEESLRRYDEHMKKYR